MDENSGEAAPATSTATDLPFPLDPAELPQLSNYPHFTSAPWEHENPHKDGTGTCSRALGNLECSEPSGIELAGYVP